MPRWLGALILIVFCIVGVYQGVTDPCIQLRGQINGRDGFSSASTVFYA